MRPNGGPRVHGAGLEEPRRLATLMRNCAMQGYLDGYSGLTVDFRPAEGLELVLQR